MFIDKAVIHVKAGRGGKGCSSFYRDNFMRPPKRFKKWKGRPDGGNGGNGGNVIIEADRNLYSLYDLKFNRHFRAQDGSNGGPNNRKGAEGKDCRIKVPTGTLIRDIEKGYLLKSLDKEGEQVAVVKGGNPGYGNGSREQVTEAVPGEERTLELELKVISDVGIIGFPNAGKSTLICAISNANSRIASFPFTTKAPVLGVVNFGEFKFTAVDVPGLIEGAHEGKGLGLSFLRHIKHCKVLLHLVDISGKDGRNPVEDYRILNKELEYYDKEILSKPQLIVANKMDLPRAAKNLADFKKIVKKKVIPISALNREGIADVLKVIKGLLKET